MNHLNKQRRRVTLNVIKSMQVSIACLQAAFSNPARRVKIRAEIFFLKAAKYEIQKPST